MSRIVFRWAVLSILLDCKAQVDELSSFILYFFFSKPILCQNWWNRRGASSTGTGALTLCYFAFSPEGILRNLPRDSTRLFDNNVINAELSCICLFDDNDISWTYVTMNVPQAEQISVSWYVITTVKDS